MSQAGIFGQVMWVLLGIMSWEIISTIKFDYRTVTNLKEFKWPLTFYFTCRYSILVALILLNFVNSVKSEINCQASYTSAQLFGNIAIGTASNLLMFRSMAIWSRTLWVVIPLTLIALGHWAILLHGVIAVRSVWSPVANVCVVTGTSSLFLRLLYGYTMAFDLLVLVLSVAGLMRTGHGRGSGLWKLLFRDGIAYFAVAFVGNFIAFIFAILHLNAAMDIMFTVPAATFSSIVACRAVMRLSDWTGKDVYVHSSARMSSRQPSSAKRSKSTNPGVHISMDTYSKNSNAEVEFYRGGQSGMSTIDLERATNGQSVDEIIDVDKDMKYSGTSFMPMH